MYSALPSSPFAEVIRILKSARLYELDLLFFFTGSGRSPKKCIKKKTNALSKCSCKSLERLVYSVWVSFEAVIYREDIKRGLNG